MDKYKIERSKIMVMGFFVDKMREKAKLMLHDNEQILFMFRQSLLNKLAPTFIVATDERLIIIDNSFWGLYLGVNLIAPTNYNYIPYNRVTGAVLVRGKIFTTVAVRLLGGLEINFQGKNEGEIDGLRLHNAIALEKFVVQQVKRLDEKMQEGKDRPLAYRSGHFRK